MSAGKEPPKFPKRLPLVRGSLTPLFSAHLVRVNIEGFDNVEAIKNQIGVRTVFLYRPDVGYAQVGAGPLDTISLVETGHFCEEPIDRFPRSAEANPYHTGAVQPVNEGRVFVVLDAGDLVDTDGVEHSHTMTFERVMPSVLVPIVS